MLTSDKLERYKHRAEGGDSQAAFVLYEHYEEPGHVQEANKWLLASLSDNDARLDRLPDGAPVSGSDRFRLQPAELDSTHAAAESGDMQSAEALYLHYSFGAYDAVAAAKWRLTAASLGSRGEKARYPDSVRSTLRTTPSLPAPDEGHQMTNLTNVTDFQIVGRDPGYDKVNNPLRRSVAELTPLAIAWRSGGAQKDIRSTTGICGVPLADGSGVAIVEGPYDRTTNRAYVVNADGSFRVRVSFAEVAGPMMFYDVTYVSGTLTFLAAASDRDVQIRVSESDGAVLSVSEFR